MTRRLGMTHGPVARASQVLGALLMLTPWAWAQDKTRGQPGQSDVGISMEEYLSRLSAGGDLSGPAPVVGSSLALAPAVPWPRQERVAGEIFGTPVSVGNYAFAKRVASMFPRPWGASDLPEAEREPAIWESLILHYEAFRRGVRATDEEVETMVNGLLRNYDRPFGRRDDPDAYRRWVVETLYEEVELFENQIRYLIQIQKLKDQMLQEQRTVADEEELRQEFLNEKHHVGGEMVTFDTQEDAQTFYEQVNDPKAWETMKAKGDSKVRPVSLMTLEAYMDLWGIPKDQMYAFHAMELGAVGPPMPFGKHWCVYRLLEKRTGDLKDFPAARDAYQKQVEMKKKYEALKRWIEQLKVSARLRVF
ncbi:MAG: peptidyl-prolyl cis-trans isomerase [Candidatus Omnitrophica bacterium]|nr:peptidyl-prolyl cis-trans isomerase [Candidatus Omnitrophota bacterium]